MGKFFDKLRNKTKDGIVSAKMTGDDASFWTGEFLTSFKKNWGKMLIAIGVMPFLLWFMIVWFLKTDEILTITGKETKSTGVELVQQKDKKTGKIVEVPRNIDTYFVYTDKGALQFRPSMFFLQWEVADRFGQLQVDKTYKITHYGFRNAWFDWYENIVDFELYETPVGTPENIEQQNKE